MPSSLSAGRTERFTDSPETIEVSREFGSSQIARDFFSIVTSSPPGLAAPKERQPEPQAHPLSSSDRIHKTQGVASILTPIERLPTGLPPIGAGNEYQLPDDRADRVVGLRYRPRPSGDILTAGRSLRLRGEVQPA